jgi:DNA-binding MarR family transcriptional regulator
MERENTTESEKSKCAFEILNSFNYIQNCYKFLDPVERTIISVISSHKICYLSRETLAKQVGVSLNTIKRHLPALIKKGIIKILKGPHDIGGKNIPSDIFQIQRDKIKELLNNAHQAQNEPLNNADQAQNELVNADQAQNEPFNAAQNELVNADASSKWPSGGGQNEPGGSPKWPPKVLKKVLKESIRDEESLNKYKEGDGGGNIRIPAPSPQQKEIPVIVILKEGFDLAESKRKLDESNRPAAVRSVNQNRFSIPGLNFAK